jgi:hypothetical protein
METIINIKSRYGSEDMVKALIKRGIEEEKKKIEYPIEITKKN